MPTSLFYIIPDPTMPPFAAGGFSAYMESDTHTDFVPCWKSREKALQFLKEKFGQDSRFGVVPSTIELLQKQMKDKVGTVCEIRFMD